jgi:tetratricopeptide (TPR) repeat protein
MGRALLSQMVPALEKLTWTGTPRETAAGSLVYRTVIDQVDGYRGDPNVLGLALRTARTCDSLPYTYAAISYILLAAAGPTAADVADSATRAYDADGLATALQWLEKAQELVPEETDINVIEALIYIHARRYEDARTVLDYLHEETSDNYFLLRAEMTYWQHIGVHDQAIEWNQRAFKEATTVPQRLRLKSTAATIFREAGDIEKALEASKEALHFDSDNAWLCHEISLLYYEKGELEEATHFNERALKLQPGLSEAQQLKEELSEQQRSSGILGRFFG